MRRPTAQDVADLAGVSRSSVSLVLNGRASGNISATKQRAVVDAARQLGYRPNALALSLRSRRSRTIGVLTWRESGGLAGDILRAVWEGAAAAGYLPIVGDAPGGEDPDLRAAGALLDRQVDGLLVIAPAITAFRLPEPLAALKVVLVNCLDPDQRVTSIVADETAAGASAVQVLLERGHTAIGLLADEVPTDQARARVAGAERAAAGAGLSLRIVYGPSAISSGSALARDALTGPDRPTALVCTRERLAIGALLAARAAGLRVPEDLSVVSLDDGEQLAVDTEPELATVHVTGRAMAEHAVAMLLDAITTGAELGGQTLTFCPVTLGGSVGPPAPVTGPAGPGAGTP